MTKGNLLAASEFFQKLAEMAPASIALIPGTTEQAFIPGSPGLDLSADPNRERSAYQVFGADQSGTAGADQSGTAGADQSGTAGPGAGQQAGPGAGQQAGPGAGQQAGSGAGSAGPGAGQQAGPGAGTAPNIQLQDGIPWDARIHTSTKSVLKTAPYGWRLKNCPKDQTKEQWEAYVKGIEAELRQTMAAAGGANNSSQLQQQPQGQRQTISDIVQLVNAVTEKQIDQITINSVMQEMGLPSFSALGTRPDLIPTAAEKLGL